MPRLQEIFRIRCGRRVNKHICDLYDQGVPTQLLKVIFLILLMAGPSHREDVMAVEFFSGSSR